MDSLFSHVALLVRSVEASAEFLNFRGIQTGKPESFESEGTKEIYVGSYSSHLGLLLLLEPTANGPYQRAMTKRGPSLHHLAIDVLNAEEFVHSAQALGWKLHPASAQTMKHKAAWLFFEGFSALIEVQQKSELVPKPYKVSEVELPIQTGHVALLEGIGLGEIVTAAAELILTLDGNRLSFSQIAQT